MLFHCSLAIGILRTTGKCKLVDLIDELKNGKVDEVSSLVKEVVAKGIDDEDIGKLLAKVITLLVDLSWDENKKSTSSKSGKSSKKSSDDPPPPSPLLRHLLVRPLLQQVLPPLVVQLYIWVR